MSTQSRQIAWGHSAAALMFHINVCFTMSERSLKRGRVGVDGALILPYVITVNDEHAV